MALRFGPAGEQHAAERGRGEADHPAAPGDDDRPDAVQAGQLRVVDHRPHPGAERRAEQQEAQPEGDEQRRRRPGRCGRR